MRLIVLVLFLSDIPYNEWILIVVTVIALIMMIIIIGCICCSPAKSDKHYEVEAGLHKVTDPGIQAVSAKRRFTVGNYEWGE